jgi:signal transduction histidine kinase
VPKSAAKRRLLVPIVLIGCGLAICGWQAEEHIRFRRDEAQTLINRGRDITSTLGVVLRSQRRWFGIVQKERLENTLQGLIRPGELESVAILGSTGEAIASAGSKIDITPDMLGSRGVLWRDRTLTILNLMDLGGNGEEDGLRSRTPIVVTDERTVQSLRGPPRRRPGRPAEPRPTVPDAGATTAVNAAPATPSSTSSPAPGAETAAVPPAAAPSGSPVPGAAPASTTGTGDTAAPNSSPLPAPSAAPRANEPRPPFGRPSWMTKEEYEAVIQKQGVHSIVISLSADQMHRAVADDLLLRSLVSLLALGGAIVSTLGWRNMRRNAELQIRLVKAGEMNAHLKEMNLAAAGLAHETRNPLNLIRGLAQLIAADRDDSAKRREHATAIMEETDRVTVQLNEFINYSKPRDAQVGAVQVSRMVADVARTLVPDLEEKHLELRQPDSQLWIEADEQLLRQALFNVLLNATQAVGPHGRIEVRLTAVGPREARLEIADDGPGVPADQRAAIFRPYVTMRPKGVGLGLAIVAQIAAAHHWDIACLPNEPRGAVFRFTHLKIATPPS